MKLPNIVLIVIDDLGWRDLVCCGSDFYETPNLDRLGAEGMRFTSAYAASPVCSPTRAAIMSGKSPARVGVTQYIGGHAVGRLCDVPYHHALPASEVSVAAALRRGGYQTWHVGKWHLGDRVTAPERHGFDANLGGCGWGMPNYGHFSPYRIPNLPDGPEGEYLTDRLTDEAIRLIERRDRGGADAGQDRPFFLNFWHYAVHTPIQAPAPLVEKYRRKAAALGLDRREAIVEGEHLPVDHLRHERVQRRVFQSDPVYAAMIESLDTNIGRLMRTLREQGIERDTLVVFTSDNGGLATAEGSPTCNLPLREGKGWMEEGGVRVAQIARWPAVIAAGSVCAVPTISMDFYPTFVEAAGLPLMPGQHADGVSILPLLRGGSSLARDTLFWHYPHYSNQGGTPGCTIRRGDWKLIEFFEDGRLELYNLADDEEERHNLSAAEPARVAAMHARLREWQRETQALFPQPNPNWRPPELPEGVHPAHV